MPEPRARGARRASVDSVIRALGIKGFAMTQGAADAVLSSPEHVQPLLDDLVVDGLVASVAGAYRLTDSGKARASELVAAEAAAWGPERANAALDAFLALDQRMKEVVTAWQLKAPGRRQRPRRSEYDRDVLDRLAALHRDAAAFLEEHADGSATCDLRERLDRALDQAVRRGRPLRGLTAGGLATTASGSSSTRT